MRMFITPGVERSLGYEQYPFETATQLLLSQLAPCVGGCGPRLHLLDFIILLSAWRGGGANSWYTKLLDGNNGGAGGGVSGIVAAFRPSSSNISMNLRTIKPIFFGNLSCCDLWFLHSRPWRRNCHPGTGRCNLRRPSETTTGPWEDHCAPRLHCGLLACQLPCSVPGCCQLTIARLAHLWPFLFSSADKLTSSFFFLFSSLSCWRFFCSSCFSPPASSTALLRQYHPSAKPPTQCHSPQRPEYARSAAGE